MTRRQHPLKKNPVNIENIFNKPALRCVARREGGGATPARGGRSIRGGHEAHGREDAGAFKRFG